MVTIVVSTAITVFICMLISDCAENYYIKKYQFYKELIDIMEDLVERRMDEFRE